MNRTARYLSLLIVVTAAIAGGAWGFVHFRELKRQAVRPSDLPDKPSVDSDLWARGLEKLKEDRGGIGDVALEVPTQLRHYSERHWFLATQVAEVKKFNVQRCQDFVDLAAMIERGELVPMPAVTDTYILFGVGARVDGGAFTRYVANQNLELNDEAGLRDVYVRLQAAHAKLQKGIYSLQTQLAALGTIKHIDGAEFVVTFDGGRQVSFETEKFRHIDHGYAVTSHSSQGQTVDRVLVNAVAKESDLLLNQQMGYVAVSRAREEAMIFTNSTELLKAPLDRSVDKEMAIEALRESRGANVLSRNGNGVFLSSPTESVTEQRIEQLNPEEEYFENVQGGEEMELGLGS